MNNKQPVGSVHEVISPVTGEAIDHVTLATQGEIIESLEKLARHPFSPVAGAVFAFLKRLRDQLHSQRELFLEATCLETGFIAGDSREIIDGAIEFLDDFPVYVQETLSHHEQIPPFIRHSYSGESERHMRIVQRPYRCVAAVVPQNAFLTLSIVIIASALYAGSRVILRPPLQSAHTGHLLARAIMESDPPQSGVVVINSLASDFLEACYASNQVDLIHYIGSNQYAASVLTRGFSSGKTCLVDGQGNGMVYLDDTFPLEDAVRIITSGATAFNGETCTSINGVLVKNTLYQPFKEAVVDAFQELRVGHPLEQGIRIGPLFSEKQARELDNTLKDTPTHKVLCGGHAEGAYFRPAVVEDVRPHDPLVREGLFGPALWIQSIREDALWTWLNANRFPLSDTVLSNNDYVIRSFATHSRAGRIVINEDPSVESMFEPWGGYPPSGMNPISLWVDKYRQTLQIDGRLKAIKSIPTNLINWD